MNGRRLASLAGSLVRPPLTAVAVLVWIDVVAYLAEAASWQLRMSGASYDIWRGVEVVLSVGLFCLPPLVLGWRLARTGDLRWAPLVVLWSGALPMRMVWTLCGSDPNSSDYSLWPLGLIAAVIASVVVGSVSLLFPRFVGRFGRTVREAGDDDGSPAPLLSRYRGRAAWALLYIALGTVLLTVVGPFVVIVTWGTAPYPGVARWVWFASLGAAVAFMMAASATCPDPAPDDVSS